jgi:hypothetical protein
VALSWKAVPGAVGYRVQVARDLSFLELLRSEDVTDTGYAFRPGEAGTYAWRVAARDAAGRMGEYGFVRRLFVEAGRVPVGRPATASDTP